jgi:hypothetical protein
MMTPQEYLDRERKAEHKSEYYNGEVFAMSGVSRDPRSDQYSTRLPD